MTIVRVACRQAGLALLCLSQLVASDPVSPPATVIFVCEHGSAKSVVAATHFNRLAQARGLPIRAVAKGLTPDPGLPLQVRQGLISDGISLGSFVPVGVQREDFRPGSKVVALGCNLNLVAPEGVSLETWMDLPAVSDGYAPAREAIVIRVRKLIDSMTKPERCALR